MSGLVYPVLILNIILANIIFPLGKMIGMVQLRTSRSRETDSPLTDGRGRMKLYHARIDHTHLTHTFERVHFSVSTVSVI